MKVVHVLAPARFGGLERVVHDLAIGQRKNGHDVRAILLLETGVAEPPLAAELDDAKVPAVRVVEPARSFLAQRRALVEIANNLAPDVVHTHGYLPDVLAASLSRSFRPARVSTVHGFTGGGWRNRFYERLQRRSYSRLDAVVAVSRKLASDLAAFVPARLIRVVPNAWRPAENPLSPREARAQLSLSTDTFNIGWVGRISREKGPDLLIEALSSLIDINIRVSMIGDGVERPRLEQRAKELGVDDRVSWQGELPRAAQFFPAFDLFVLSSRTEGTPITLFEAMDASVPIVATSVGGVADVVTSNEAILIDDPAALASAIRQVHDAPADARDRATRAHDRLEKKFSASEWISAYDRIYRDVARTRGHA